MLSSVLVKLLIKYSHQLDLLDVPNERSSHCNVIPSGAGVGFISAFFIGMITLESSLFLYYWYIFASIFIVFLAGVIDDREDVTPRTKLFFIFVATFLLWFNGLSFSTLGVWYGYNLNLPSVMALLFSLFVLSGVTNALNLLDGIDGLAGSVSLVILLFFALLGFEYHSDIIVILSTFSMAAIVGFLFFNWNPAKIFMGDSGSLALGFIISVLIILSLKYIHPIVLFYLVALPVLDTMVVMVRRIRRKKSPFSPDKTHIHHIMVKFFDGNVRKTVFFLVILQIIFSSIGYIILDSINKNGGANVPLFAFFGAVLMCVLFYMIFTGIKRRQNVLDEKH